jgi:DNA-binding response OmpR family regulator
MRIGILEDDPELTGFLVNALSAADHLCFAFSSGQKLLAFLHHETVDMLLLDWNVPDVSGLSILRSLRQNAVGELPIVMLTSRAAEEDMVTALHAGADDYIVKPISAAVLLARLEALQRRTYREPAPSSLEQFGSYIFENTTKTVRLGERAIQLTAKEFALALMLFRNLHRPLSRSYLFEAIWGGNPDLQTRTLDAHISKIRSKLGLRPDNGFRLVTVYAYGYRLEAIQG